MNRINYKIKKLTNFIIAHIVSLSLSLPLSVPIYADQNVDERYNRAVGDIVLSPGQAAHNIKSANGVVVTNINAPDRAGNSVNHFKKLNINNDGHIYNNIPKNTRPDAILTNTKIGGQVSPNPNLKNGSARTIISEVNNNNVKINGSIEVAGNKANLVIVSPKGIVVNGGKVLNVGDLKYIGGKVEYDKSGNIAKYITSKEGIVSFKGKGENIARLDYFTVISRQIKGVEKIVGAIEEIDDKENKAKGKT